MKRAIIPRAIIPVPTLGHSFLLYLAGLFDGEGCVTISRSKKRPADSRACHTAEWKIVMTHEGCIRAVAWRLNRPYSRLPRQRVDHKDSYRVAIHDLDGVAAILDQLLPHLIVKADVAQAVLNFCRSRLSDRGTNYNRSYNDSELGWCRDVMRLNRKGQSQEVSL